MASDHVFNQFPKLINHGSVTNTDNEIEKARRLVSKKCEDASDILAMLGLTPSEETSNA